MIKRLSTVVALLFLFSGLANAQKCATDDIRENRLQKDPAFAQAVQLKRQAWADFLQNPTSSLVANSPQGPVYEIPVVIHVMHTGGAVGTIYNPTDLRLTQMIDYINDAYATTWAGYPDSTNGGTRFPVKFVLAKRTPDCQATNGINRINVTDTAYVSNGVKSSGSNPGVNDVVVKDLSRWPRDQYYNIWVVNKINGKDGTSGTFTAGFAFTVPAPANRDGTIMLATQSRSNRVTVVHEIGHSFDLLHTFKDGETVCPPNTNCSQQGDEVCDTEPHIIPTNFACQTTGTNSCTSAPWGTVANNFMNYTNCQNRFTPDQRTRFMFTLLNYRPELINSLGATALSAVPIPTASTCIPTTNPATNNNSSSGPRDLRVADMYASSGSFAQDGSVVYRDLACQGISNLAVGQTYPVSVQTGYWPERVRIYIDYNNNGIFTDPGETVYTHDGTQNNELHTGTFTVPQGVTTCIPLRVRVLSDRATAAVPGPCSQLGYGQAEDYAALITGPSNTVTVSAAITSGGNPSCFGTSVAVTATPTGTTTNVTYKWFVNGNLSSLSTSNTLTSSNYANGDVVTVRVFYTGPCGADSSTSNGVIINRAVSITPSVTLTIIRGSNPSCSGQTITFKATPVAGGSAPTYLFQVDNGGGFNTVQNSLVDTFNTASLNVGDQVRVIVNSNSPCALPTVATSAPIAITFANQVASVNIAITGGTNPSCFGKPVTFTATPTNGGTNPFYNWTVNAAASGATGNTFTTTSLVTGDVVGVTMTSSNTCVTQKTVTSPTITMTVVRPTDTSKITVAITQGSNPGCKDSLLTFEATPTFFGPNFTIFWLLNSSVAAVGNPLSGTTLFSNGDVLVAMAVANSLGCRTSDTVYSAPIVLVRSLPAPAPFISWVGGSLVSNVPNIQWYGPDGLIIGATGGSYTPQIPGNYYAVQTSGGCNSVPSNALFTQNVSVGQYDLNKVNIYPNPTTGLLQLDWNTTQSLVRLNVTSITGQLLNTKTVSNTKHIEMDLSSLASGIYFLNFLDEEGHTATVKVSVSH